MSMLQETSGIYNIHLSFFLIGWGLMWNSDIKRKKIQRICFRRGIVRSMYFGMNQKPKWKNRGTNGWRARPMRRNMKNLMSSSLVFAQDSTKADSGWTFDGEDHYLSPLFGSGALLQINDTITLILICSALQYKKSDHIVDRKNHWSNHERLAFDKAKYSTHITKTMCIEWLPRFFDSTLWSNENRQIHHILTTNL
jgi:hypothetical protein